MKGQELTLVFRDNLAFLTEEVALDLSQLEISYAPARFRAPAFWTIRVLDYNEITKRLFVEVLSYEVGEVKFSSNQLALADDLITVERVGFRSIDTFGLLKTLNSTTPFKVNAPKPENFVREDNAQPKPQRQTIQESFIVPLKKVSFLDGGVAFEKKFPAFKNPIQFLIVNENILKEFDAVKNYFIKALGTKSIEVTATVEIVGGIVSEAKATSSEIQRIDESMIEEAKISFVKTMRTNETPDSGHLFTMEEMIQTATDDGSSDQPFFDNETGLFDSLLNISGTKHYRHLRLLSSRHKKELVKLRFIQKPFSFLFLWAGSQNYYWIWETLDTEEATYIWTTPTNSDTLSETLIYIDKTIQLIKREGKNNYIKRNEPNFYRIIHDYADAASGFILWKEEIEQYSK